MHMISFTLMLTMHFTHASNAQRLVLAMNDIEHVLSESAIFEVFERSREVLIPFKHTQ